MNTRPLSLAIAIALSVLACGMQPDDAASSSSAVTSRHVLVVGAATGGAATGTEADAGSLDAASADAPAEDDDVEEPTLSERATGGGAYLRTRRMELAPPVCLLPPGKYALTSAPRLSPDEVFWHVAFAAEPKGVGGEPCGRSGWVEAGAVRFEQVAVDEPDPEPEPGGSRSSCAADPSFAPRFLKPVEGPVTGRFGDCRDGCSRRHAGIDVAAASGTPLRAPEDGVVIDARTNRGACGTVLEIRHPNGSSTRYCHNRRLLVGIGDCVTRGQTVAEVGNTGVGTGPHMHLEYYPSPTGGAADPARVFGYR